MSKSTKKILVVIGSFKVGGAEKMAITLGTEWTRLGHDVHYALIRPIFEIPNEIPASKIHLLSNRTGRSTRLQHIQNLFNIFKLNLSLRVDVAVGFTYFSSFVACFSMCKKVIGTFDVYPYQFAKKRAKVSDFVIRWPFVKKVVCPSCGLFEEVIKHRPHFKKKGQVIYNTLNFEEIEAKGNEIQELPERFSDKPFITAMGRLTPGKNFEMLLSAFSKSKISERYNLIIIGGGGHEADIRNHIAELDLQDKVYMPGFLKNPYPLINKSELFVNTSNFESFSLVILESLILSVPVIATNCKSGPAELITDDFNGKLVPVKDVVKLTEVLNDVAGNIYLLEKWEKNIPKSLLKFKIEGISNQWAQIL